MVSTPDTRRKDWVVRNTGKFLKFAKSTLYAGLLYIVCHNIHTGEAIKINTESDTTIVSFNTLITDM